MSVYDQAQLYQPWGLTSRLCSQIWSLVCLEASLDDCLHLRVPSAFLPADGEVALGYIELGYRPVRLFTQFESAHLPLNPCSKQPVVRRRDGWESRKGISQQVGFFEPSLPIQDRAFSESI